MSRPQGTCHCRKCKPPGENPTKKVTLTVASDAAQRDDLHRLSFKWDNVPISVLVRSAIDEYLEKYLDNEPKGETTCQTTKF